MMKKGMTISETGLMTAWAATVPVGEVPSPGGGNSSEQAMASQNFARPPFCWGHTAASSHIVTRAIEPNWGEVGSCLPVVR